MVLQVPFLKTLVWFCSVLIIEIICHSYDLQSRQDLQAFICALEGPCSEHCVSVRQCGPKCTPKADTLEASSQKKNKIQKSAPQPPPI